MQRILGVNCFSLFPWSLGKEGMKRAVDRAQALGAQGILALPFRGWQNGRSVPKETIISIMPAWNSGSLGKALGRLVGLNHHPDPNVLDWVLFGRNPDSVVADLRQKYPAAIESDYSFGSLPIEIHPEAGVDPRRYLNYRSGVVWDTMHVRRQQREGGPAVGEGNWRNLLTSIKGDRIKLIHVHPSAKEALRFVHFGEVDPETTEMLLKLSRKTTCPVILEVFPGVGGWGIRKLLEYLRWCFNE